MSDVVTGVFAKGRVVPEDVSFEDEVISYSTKNIP